MRPKGFTREGELSSFREIEKGAENEKTGHIDPV